MLRDGDDPSAASAQHRLEGHGVLPLAGEAGEFPDQYLRERSLRPSGVVEHPAELGPVGDASALGLVYVLAGNDVSVLFRIIPQSSQLRGDREIDVLSVARNPRVQRHGGKVPRLVVFQSVPPRIQRRPRRVGPPG